MSVIAAPIAPSLQPLMRFTVNVAPEIPISRASNGAKLSICYFLGGTFEGARLQGSVLPGGGDWANYKNEDLLDIDVRGVLRTVDGATIYLEYRGLWRSPTGRLTAVLSPGGDRHFVKEEHYLRVIARFETADARYLWLNSVLALGVGERTTAGVAYDFFEIG